MPRECWEEYSASARGRAIPGAVAYWVCCCILTMPEATCHAAPIKQPRRVPPDGGSACERRAGPTEMLVAAAELSGIRVGLPGRRLSTRWFSVLALPGYMQMFTATGYRG